MHVRPWCVRLWVALPLLAGCSGMAARRVAMPDLFQAWHLSAAEDDQLSPRTLQTLRRLDLETVYHRDPAAAHARLHALTVTDPQPDLVFGLAEISFLLGRHTEKHNCAASIAYYYLSAGYAYHFLFADGGLLAKCPAADAVGPANSSPAKPPGIFPVLEASPFDPRFRLACDLYNAGLAKCIRAAQRVGELDPRKELHLKTPDGKGYTLSIAHHGFAWRAEEFGPLVLAEDYAAVGLANQYRSYGLGVPLVGTRDPAAPAPGHAFYPREVAFPVTAFFRFEGSLADLGECRAGRLELFNPLAIQTVQVQRQRVPLQTDLTTPLAYFLKNTDLSTVDVTGFLRAERLQKQAGIYMFEPHQPGKIPVLMVHGLLSSPVTWAPLFNDLRADPALRDRFQFWFYLYPTGNPYLIAAADLRDTLGELRRELDPERRDGALDEMVLVGHSMGGLVSRLLTADSGDAFFRLVSTQPFDSFKGRPETLSEVRRAFFFERKTCVRRVIYIATPHHGSKLSPSWPARLAVQFVKLPNRLVEATQDLAAENPNVWTTIREQLPTSVDLLAPNAPALQLLAAQPRPADVRFHSIIGVLPPGPELLGAVLAGDSDKRGTDGVVKYSSAHLDDVDSELVVPANHSLVHHHPLTALEVRRILLQHVSPGKPPDGPVLTAGHSAAH